MNLQSKFGYCITTQTLNIAHCLKAGWNYGQTDDPISMPPANILGQGHKKDYGNLKKTSKNLLCTSGAPLHTVSKLRV